MGQPVVHFEVIGNDGANLRQFYSDLFEWDVVEVGGPMNYGVVDRNGNTNADGAGIGGGIGGGVGGDHVTFYVEVDDIEGALARAGELGGSKVWGPDEVPGQGITIAHFNDPEGHLIGLVSPTG